MEAITVKTPMHLWINGQYFPRTSNAQHLHDE